MPDIDQVNGSANDLQRFAGELDQMVSSLKI
jgi:hypothetical protein